MLAVDQKWVLSLLVLVDTDIRMHAVEVPVLLRELVKAARLIDDRDLVDHTCGCVRFLCVIDAHRRVDLDTRALNNLLRVPDLRQVVLFEAAFLQVILATLLLLLEVIALDIIQPVVDTVNEARVIRILRRVDVFAVLPPTLVLQLVVVAHAPVTVLSQLVDDVLLLCAALNDRLWLYEARHHAPADRVLCMIAVDPRLVVYV